MIAFNAIHAEITWKVTDGTLIISGTEMEDYYVIKPAPWKEHEFRSVIIENGVTNIGSYAFFGCSGFTSITIPNSVTSIGQNAFFGCSALISVTIPNSVTNIETEVFRDCSALTSVDIPNSVISIGEYAFVACSGLTSITIPNSVTNIGKGVFSGCESLSSVTIPKSVRSIENSVFSGCNSLNSLLVENGNLIYDSRDNSNAIIETKSNTLIVGCKNTVIPESVTRIGDYAFNSCVGLTSITIPSSVYYIGPHAFHGCIDLTSITIPSSINSISYSAFGGCSSLTSVTLLDGVQVIQNNAFSSCVGLTSITIPKSVTDIGSGAFSGCTGLTSLTCNAIVPPACGQDCFSQVDKSIPLYVPENSVNAYIGAKYWNSFADILPISVDPTLALTLTDKNSDLKKGYYQKGKVTLSRSNMSVGDYATFCLPFDIDLSKTKDNFSKVYIPLNIGLLNPSGTLLLLLDEVNDNSIIKAGQTFVAKCKKTDAVFENCADVTFNESTPNPNPSSVKIYNFDGVSGALTQNTDVKMKIGGSYSQLTNLDRNNYCTLFANGMFDATTSVTPFQMYVYMDGNNTLGSKVISIAFEFNDVATDIKELGMTNEKSPTYDLNGRRVNENAKKSGIYIGNGKKVVVK